MKPTIIAVAIMFTTAAFGDVAAGDDTIFENGFENVGVEKAFEPPAIEVGTTSVLTITLTNRDAATATLSADLVDTFPQGLVVATPSDAASTCLSATVKALAGADTVTLDSGAVIPAGGSCTVTVSVTSAVADTYSNVIAAGALQTDVGNSATAASADLTVTDSGSCSPLQLLRDPGFELTDTTVVPFTNPFWDGTSTNFETAFCDEFLCGNGGGSALPHDGAIWVWLGGAQAAETATASQSVIFPAGQTRFLNFWLWIGAIGDGSTNLDVAVDGTVITSYPEPLLEEAGYTQRGIDVSSFADGAAHTIEFIYTSPGSALSNYSLDDVTLDCAPAPLAHPLRTLRTVNGPAGHLVH